MKKDNLLSELLATLLKGEGAHADFATAVKDMPADARGKRPDGAEHTPWQLLEHLRIAQWDILEYTRDAKHVSPDFPAGYWPTTDAPADGAAWDRSVASFQKDLAAMIALVSDESTDLLAPIPHADGKTVLREALLLADHNAYHLGQLVLVRRLLGTWK